MLHIHIFGMMIYKADNNLLKIICPTNFQLPSRCQISYKSQCRLKRLKNLLSPPRTHFTFYESEGGGWGKDVGLRSPHRSRNCFCIILRLLVWVAGGYILIYLLYTTVIPLPAVLKEPTSFKVFTILPAGKAQRQRKESRMD